MQAVIVGSGIGGIATAIRLAVQGYKVTVYESNSYPGGKLTAFEKDGYRFDAGPSLFTLPHLVDELFELAGESAREKFPYLKKDIACRYFWRDHTELTAWSDSRKFAVEVEEVLGESQANILEHLEDVKRLYERTKGLFLEKSLHKLDTYLSIDVLKALQVVHKLHLTESLHGVAAKKFHSDKLVQLFDRYATYNGSNPYKAPGVLAMIPHLEHNIGTFLPERGMHQITEELVALAERNGVSFVFNSKVKRIEVIDGVATGVELENGQFHPAEVVVSNMDIVPTYRHLLADQPAPEKTLMQERSSSALIFYWGVNREFPQLDLHNILFSSDYRREFHEIFDEKVAPSDPTVYINITSKDVKGEAPEGSENWFVMVNVPSNQGQDWEREIKKTRESVIARINEQFNVDIESHIDVEELLTPELIESKTSSFGGALYGASSNSSMSAFFRHPNFSRKIDNLFFVGGSVHPGGGIPLCLLSARIVDQLVKEN